MASWTEEDDLLFLESSNSDCGPVYLTMWTESVTEPTYMFLTRQPNFWPHDPTDLKQGDKIRDLVFDRLIS